MDAYLLDWLNLLLRWAHVITGIAWIGASFYFVGLDNSLTPPEDAKDKEKGIGGELWAVHGGGFYHQQKYPVSPKKLPEQLHWSMWESYSTWLTGFALFTVLYLYQASTFLIDKTVFDWSPAAAISTALAFFVAFWVIYDAICRIFGRGRNGDVIVGTLVLVFIVFASWLSCRLFAGRAAFLLVGAMVATTMSANVFFWIIPGQRKVVAALRAGEPVDPVHGQRGKQRSVHNTYFTLPVLIAMLSNHYGMLYSHPQNWLVLVLLMLVGVLVRTWFVKRHKGVDAWPLLVAVVMLLAGLIAWLAPQPAMVPVTAAPALSAPATSGAASTEATADGKVSFETVKAIVAARCLACHNAALAPKRIQFHEPQLIEQHAAEIYQQVVVQKSMPLNNATGITDEERATLGRWFKER